MRLCTARAHPAQLWGMLQFVSPTSSRQQQCKNIEFPGRYLAEQSFLAQRSFAAVHNNSFATSTAQLKEACVAPGCDSSAFAVLAEHPEVFEVGVNVTVDAHELTRECSSRPCFTVSVGVSVPGSSGYGYTVRVTNNHLVEVQHETKPGEQTPCLDDNLSMR